MSELRGDFHIYLLHLFGCLSCKHDSHIAQGSAASEHVRICPEHVPETY